MDFIHEVRGWAPRKRHQFNTDGVLRAIGNIGMIVVGIAGTYSIMFLLDYVDHIAHVAL